jgi:Uma2 family endonuclease
MLAPCTYNVPMGLPQRDAKHHTYADYLAWPEEVRYELIDGIAYLMSPAPTREHQGLVGEIYHQARTALEGKVCKAYVAPLDVRLPKAAEADEKVDTVVQPDVLIVCDPRKLDRRGVRGAPDWVAEVLSPSTAAHDQITKLTAYERAGVPEVWLLHPLDRTLAIYRLEGGRYGRATIHEFKGQIALTAVAGVVIDWDRVVEALGPVTE